MKVYFQNQLNDLIIGNLKEIIQLLTNITLEDLEYTTKRGKRYNFSRYSLPIVFLRGIHKGSFSLKMLMKNKDRESMN